MNKLGIDEFVSALMESPPEERVEALVAVGGFGVKNHDRIGIIVLEETPRIVADAYFPSEQLDELWRRIAHARPKARARRGGWNTMHATGWSFAWTDDRGPLMIVDEKGRLAWMDADQLHLREGEPIPRLSVASVESYLDNGWIRRGVRVRLTDDRLVPIAFEDDQSPAADPFYDGLNLMADTFWVHDLAHAVSRGLGPPVVDKIG